VVKSAIKFDRKKLDNIQKFIDANHSVKIGVLASTEERTDTEFGAIALAAVHEFGSPSRNIPERSFLRKTMVNRKSDFQKDYEAAKDIILEKIADGKGDVFLNEIGMKWVGYVQQTFVAQGPGWAPLSPRRIAQRSKTGRAKNNSNKEKFSILWDTGQLLRSINYEVV
jgi:hypothetical protein